MTLYLVFDIIIVMKITVPVQLKDVFDLFYATQSERANPRDVKAFNDIIMERLRFMRLFMGRYDKTKIEKTVEITRVNFSDRVNFGPFGKHAGFVVQMVNSQGLGDWRYIEIDWFNTEAIEKLRDSLLAGRKYKATECIKMYREKIKECTEELNQIAAIKKEDEPDLFSDEVISQIESEGVDHLKNKDLGDIIHE